MPRIITIPLGRPPLTAWAVPFAAAPIAAAPALFAGLPAARVAVSPPRAPGRAGGG